MSEGPQNTAHDGPLDPGTHVLGGELVFVEHRADRAEVEALAKEVETAAFLPEAVKSYLGEVITFLLLPTVQDMFDIRYEDNSELAHSLRREWEIKLPREVKLQVDNNRLTGGLTSGALKIFEYMKLFSTLPHKADEYKNAEGTIPEALASLGDQAMELEIEFNRTYKTLSPLDRLAFADKTAAFLKDAVRKLVDAYKS